MLRLRLFLRRFHFIKHIYAFFTRQQNENAYVRVIFQKKIKKINTLIYKYNMAGFLLERQKIYLITWDDIYLYYNISNPSETLGDGQGQEFNIKEKATQFELFLLSYFKDKGLTYFDIGANNGYYYSLKVAKNIEKSVVYAFEPDQKIINHLKENVSFNKLENKINIIEEALTDYCGTALLTKDLGASGYLVVNKEEKVSKVEVKCRTLDDFVQSNNIKGIDIIKVDIEGGEYNFLKGAEKSIECFRPLLLLEFNENLLKRSRASQNDVLNFLKKFDYTIVSIKGTKDIFALKSTEFEIIKSRYDIGSFELL
ncbi:MAG: FkbM family methyltransferase [Clostridia bacterium]|nr:FkbM family methyltransferase [Clostridia bacterium]